jgi:peroxiredoxin
MKKIISLFMILFALTAAAPLDNGYQVGDTVKDFKLKNVDGKMVSLSDYKNVKGIILVFDCNTCPVSKKYNERIIALNQKYASAGVPLIAINPNSPESSPDDSYPDMVAYARKKGYTFPYLYDEAQETPNDFGATNTPHVFLLKNVSGNFQVAYIGAIDNNSSDGSQATRRYVEEAVDALLANQTIRTPQTKAIGCSIKWKKV